jgi:formimidoylglutamate deiminase
MQALGRASGVIAPGNLADLVAIDSNQIALCALQPQQLIDGWLFAAGESVVADVWSAGRHIVRNGRHVAHERIANRYRAVMRGLVARL